MSERADADRLAERLLNEPNADPDDDLRMLSRQLLRRREAIGRLEKHLASIQDNTLDLINANRDAVLSKHEEAFRLIRQCLKDGDREKQLQRIGKILDALGLFHPMHGESWRGWPAKDE